MFIYIISEILRNFTCPSGSPLLRLQLSKPPPSPPTPMTVNLTEVRMQNIPETANYHIIANIQINNSGLCIRIIGFG